MKFNGNDIYPIWKNDISGITYSTITHIDHDKEIELLKKEIELLKKEIELLKISPPKNIHEGNIYKIHFNDSSTL